MSYISEKPTLEEYLQSSNSSVSRITHSVVKHFDRFTKMQYDRSSIQVIQDMIKEANDDKWYMVINQFIEWLQQPHSEIEIIAGNYGQFKRTFTGVHPRTIQLYITHLKNVLDDVYGVEFTDRRTRKKIRFPKIPDLEPEPFTKEEIRLMIDYASPNRKVLYMVLKDSGLRIGEAVQIRKCHVDLTKNPIEIHIPANITKTKKSRTTYVTRETVPFLHKKMLDIADNELIFGTSESSERSLNTEEAYFQQLRKELGVHYPKFLERYEENKRHKKNLHSFRAYTSTQCEEAVDEAFGHAIIGHKSYLSQYIRNQNKMPEKYLRAENYLMIYETIEVIDQSSELSELRNEISRIKRDSESFKKLTEEKIRLEIEIENQRKELLLARQGS